MEELAKLKQLYEQGFVEEAEYHTRRQQLIDEITQTQFHDEPAGGSRDAMSSRDVLEYEGMPEYAKPEHMRQKGPIRAQPAEDVLFFAADDVSDMTVPSDYMASGDSMALEHDLDSLLDDLMAGDGPMGPEHPKDDHGRWASMKDAASPSSSSSSSNQTKPVAKPRPPPRATTKESTRWQSEAATKPGAIPTAKQVAAQKAAAEAAKTKEQKDMERIVFRAIVGKDVEVMRDLHDAGADFNIREEGAGNTPLHIACAIGIREVVQFLVERGAKINVKNNDRKTPLHVLVERRWADLAKWLLYQGADIGLKDRYGKTPLDYAHPWLVGELKEILNQRERAKAVAKGSVVVTHSNVYGDQPQTLNIKAGTGATTVDQVIESTLQRDEVKEILEDVAIVLSDAKTEKTFQVSNLAVAADCVVMAAQAFKLASIADHLGLYVRTGRKVKGNSGTAVAEPDEAVDPQANISRIRSEDWPEPDAYKFVLKCLPGTPEKVTTKYRRTMYAGRALPRTAKKAPPKKKGKSSWWDKEVMTVSKGGDKTAKGKGKKGRKGKKG